MYKIYINEIPLIICSTHEKSAWDRGDKVLSAPFLNKKHTLQYINALEKSQLYDRVVIYGAEPKKIYKTIKSLFEVIKAAGGIVLNDHGEVLTIYRRGKWDLPKGKKDKGEKNWETALREVEEETGVSGLKIVSKLDKSYHVYRLRRGSRVLKITRWYLMKAPAQPLIPQEEEDIEKAVWMPLDKMEWFGKNTYSNIGALVEGCTHKIQNFVFSLHQEEVNKD